MTLPEKLLELRTARGLSQGDLAERLGVSRQSVSKWEMGQSVPELDKIIKLARLYGVTVDELVLGERPISPAQDLPEREAQAAPTPGAAGARWAPSPCQTVGVVFEGLGVGMSLVGVMGAPLMVLAGAALVVLGMPLLLAKRHPFLICGWLFAAGSYLIYNPATSGRLLRWALPQLLLGLLRGHMDVGYLIVAAQAALVLVLLGLSLRAWRREGA